MPPAERLVVAFLATLTTIGGSLLIWLVVEAFKLDPGRTASVVAGVVFIMLIYLALVTWINNG